MTLLPAVSRLALKEWAIAVNALSTGQQIMVLRKGGIHRNDKAFRIVHPEFLLFPTYEHQAPHLLKEQYRGDLAETLEDGAIEDFVQISAWTEVSEVIELREGATLSKLSPYHIWTDDYAQKRFHWRPKHPLTVALLRVYILQHPRTIPVIDEYIGCKSWVELDHEVKLGIMEPVLSDAEFHERTTFIKDVLQEGGVTASLWST